MAVEWSYSTDESSAGPGAKLRVGLLEEEEEAFWLGCICAARASGADIGETLQPGQDDGKLLGEDRWSIRGFGVCRVPDERAAAKRATASPACVP